MRATPAAALTALTAGQRVAVSEDPAIAYVRGLGDAGMAILGDKARGILWSARSRSVP